MTSKAAKAASIMMYVQTEDMDLAVKVYDALAKSTTPVDKVLGKFKLQRYGAFEDMDDGTYWEHCMEMSAYLVDKAIDHFNKEKTK